MRLQYQVLSYQADMGLEAIRKLSVVQPVAYAGVPSLAAAAVARSTANASLVPQSLRLDIVGSLVNDLEARLFPTGVSAVVVVDGGPVNGMISVLNSQQGNLWGPDELLVIM